MKALRFAKTGDLSALALEERPIPMPGPHEVLVRVHAAGLNSSDVSNVLGKHPYTTLPRTPGRDFAGVVVAGPAALVGQAVWGTGKQFGFSRDGSHAELLTAPEDGVALKPPSLSFAQAASCGVPYTTAWSALERCGVGEGTRLLVVGAAGGVGSAAIALARARGAQVGGAVRQPAQKETLEAQGVPTVLVAEGEPLAKRAKAVFGEGAHVVLDTTGAWLAEAVAALAPYGRIGVIVAQGEGNVCVPVRDLYRRAGSIVGINSLLLDAADCARILGRVGAAFDAGTIAPPGGMKEVALAQAVDAYRELQRGGRAKLVFVSAREASSGNDGVLADVGEVSS